MIRRLCLAAELTAWFLSGLIAVNLRRLANTLQRGLR